MTEAFWITSPPAIVYRVRIKSTEGKWTVVELMQENVSVIDELRVPTSDLASTAESAQAIANERNAAFRAKS